MDTTRIKAISVLGYNFGLHMLRSILPGGEEDQAELFRSYFYEDRITSLTPREQQDLYRFDGCVSCGLCPAACRVMEAAKGRFQGPMSIASSASRSHPDFIHDADSIFLCAACGQCEPICPEAVPVSEIVGPMRAMMWRVAPEALPASYQTAKANLEQYGAIHGKPELPDLKPAGKGRSALVLGPALARDRESAERIVSVLGKLGREVGGIEEGSVGGVAEAIGLVPDVGWVGALAELDTDEIIVAGPEEWLALKADERLAGKSVVHALEAVRARLPEKIKFPDDVKPPVALHHPYPMARRSELWRLGREMLERGGLEIVELDPRPEEAPPLGWEGGLELAYPQLAKELAKARVQDAEAAGAKTIITVAADDKRMLDERGVGAVGVVDLFELLGRSLG